MNRDNFVDLAARLLGETDGRDWVADFEGGYIVLQGEQGKVEVHRLVGEVPRMSTEVEERLAPTG